MTYGTACLLVGSNDCFAITGVVGADPEVASIWCLSSRDIEGPQVGSLNKFMGYSGHKSRAGGESKKELGEEIHREVDSPGRVDMNA